MVTCSRGGCQNPPAFMRKTCDPHLAAARVRQRRYTDRIGREGVRAANLRRAYGITVEDYEAMHAAQGGVCAICGSESNYYKAGALCALAVDHDHETGKVRGLLCNHCNRAIGMLKDDADVIERAASYVRGIS